MLTFINCHKICNGWILILMSFAFCNLDLSIKYLTLTSVGCLTLMSMMNWGNLCIGLTMRPNNVRRSILFFEVFCCRKVKKMLFFTQSVFWRNNKTFSTGSMLLCVNGHLEIPLGLVLRSELPWFPPLPWESCWHIHCTHSQPCL